MFALTQRIFPRSLVAASLVLASATVASDKHDSAKLVPMDREALRQELSISRGRVVLVNLWAT